MNRSVFRAMVIGALALVAGLAAAQEDRTVSDNVTDEDALIAILQSDAGWEEKHTACRSLRRIGTEKSVPALAALLPDPKLSHMARFALEVMPFEEAVQALRDALSTTSGPAKVGVVISLGARRDAKAVRLLEAMLKDGNMDVARAAAGAMGRIAAPEAVTALMNTYATAPKKYHLAIEEALLTAAEQLVRQGQGDEAAVLYETLLQPDAPVHVRMGAYRGLIYAQPKQAPERLLAAVRGDDALFADLGAQIIAEAPEPQATKQYADALEALPAERQVALLRALRDRGDAAARPAVVKAMASGDKAVAAAALDALTTLGTAQDVPALAALVSSTDADLAGAAKNTLANMKHAGTDAAVAAALAGADPVVRAQLLTLLAGRGSSEAVPVASTYMADEAAPVRVAAMEIIGQLGTSDQMPHVLSALRSAPDDAERAAAAAAVSALSAREGDAALEPILAAMKAGPPEVQPALVRALGEIGTAKALKAVTDAMEDEALHGEAVRVLANWPTVDAAPELLKLAKSSDPALKDAGLRNYVRLAREEESDTKKAEMLTNAMKLAKRPEEKWAVLSAWSTVPTQQSLKVLLPYLDDPEVQNEAAVAIIAVASELSQEDAGKAPAAKALKTVIEKSKDESIKSRAQEASDKLGT